MARLLRSGQPYWVSSSEAKAGCELGADFEQRGQQDEQTLEWRERLGG